MGVRRSHVSRRTGFASKMVRVKLWPLASLRPGCTANTQSVCNQETDRTSASEGSSPRRTMQLTRILSLAHSTARLDAICWTAALEKLYGVWGCGTGHAHVRSCHSAARIID
jgi:hypothetical protein